MKGLLTAVLSIVLGIAAAAVGVFYEERMLELIAFFCLGLALGIAINLTTTFKEDGVNENYNRY